MIRFSAGPVLASPIPYGSSVGISIMPGLGVRSKTESSILKGSFIYDPKTSPRLKDGSDYTAMIYQIAAAPAPNSPLVRFNYGTGGQKSLSVTEMSCTHKSVSPEFDCPDGFADDMQTVYENNITQLGDYIGAVTLNEKKLKKLDFLTASRWLHDNAYRNEVLLKNQKTGAYVMIYQRDFLDRDTLYSYGSLAHLAFFTENIPIITNAGFSNLGLIIKDESGRDVLDVAVDVPAFPSFFDSSFKGYYTAQRYQYSRAWIFGYDLKTSVPTKKFLSNKK